MSFLAVEIGIPSKVYHGCYARRVCDTAMYLTYGLRYGTLPPRNAYFEQALRKPLL